MTKVKKIKPSLPTSQEELLGICGRAFGFALVQTLRKFNDSPAFTKIMLEACTTMDLSRELGEVPPEEGIVIDGIAKGIYLTHASEGHIPEITTAPH